MVLKDFCITKCLLRIFGILIRFDLLTHYQTTNFRLFRIERLCRRNFKFDENSRKLFKPVENNVGKGEIARYEQFLLFPQCFQKACFPGAPKGVIVWKWVKRKKLAEKEGLKLKKPREVWKYFKKSSPNSANSFSLDEFHTYFYLP